MLQSIDAFVIFKGTLNKNTRGEQDVEKERTNRGNSRNAV